MATYDDLLKKIGEFGRYQILIFLGVICIVLIPSAFNNMGIVFLGASPDHWCQSPSAAHLNLSRADLLNLTVPVQVVDGEAGFSKCQRYDRNYSGWSPEQARQALEAGPGADVTLTDCQDGWQYDTSQYKSTIVTQVGRKEHPAQSG